MAGQPNSLAGDETIRKLPSPQQRPYRLWEEDNVEGHHAESSYTRPWSSGRHTEREPVPRSLGIRNTSNNSTAWESNEDDTPPVHDNEPADSPYPKPLFPRKHVKGNLPTLDVDPQYTPNPNLSSERTGGEHRPVDRDYDFTPPKARYQSLKHKEEHDLSVHSPNVGRLHTTQWSLKPDERPEYPFQDFHHSYPADVRLQSQRRGQRQSPIAHELSASPDLPPSATQWSVRPDTEDYTSRTQITSRNYTPAIQPGSQPFATMPRQSSFRTTEDDRRAQEILLRDKNAKIERRSSLRRLVMPKSKRTTFSQRELFRAIQSVVNGNERGGPGVVEVLLVKFAKENGDINFVPRQNKPLGMVLQKRQEERSGLLEKAATCGDVEVVQLLSRYSDKTAKNNSLQIALQNRNTTTGRDTTRDDQMIAIIVSEGADVEETISTATAAGEEHLLSMLLEGNPPISAVSEALPIAVATRETLLRRRLCQMLLHKGADVNSSNGESVLQATKLVDMVLLDMLLQRRPNPPSLSRAFAIALDHLDSNHRFEACQKLIVAGARGEQVNKGLATALTSEHQNIDFLKLILRSASIDFDNGHALCQAISNNYQEHLKLMLASRPNQQSFDNALEAALRLRNARDQLKYCHLLVGAGPPQVSCSKALLIAVTAQNIEICRVFLEARASVDYNGGASITAAARSENIGILELLVGGEFQQPNNASLVAGFEISLLSGTPSPKKMKVIRLILDAGLQGHALDVALVNATKKGQEGMALCELLLKYGASASAQDGEALDICTRSGDLNLLEKLLKGSHQPSSDNLSRIFQSSLKLDRKVRHRTMEMILQAGMPIDDQVAAALDGLVQERRPDMQAIEVLLAYRASVHYERHRPLITAAKSMNRELLALLLEQSRNITASSIVFEALMGEDSFWGKPESFKILTLLINNGAEGIAVDEALTKAVKDGQPSARHFEIALLQHANIDHKDGIALQVATERGEPALIRRMLAMKPAPESISMAFPYALVSNLPESICLAVIESFVEMASEDLYPEYMHPEIPEPPVFLCVKWYPKSLSVLEATLKAGFHVDQEMSSENGKFTALYWSLTGGKKVEDHMVEFMISRGANLDNHPEPLLHLAIEKGRQSIVQALLKAGVDVDLADGNDISPLSLATQKKDIATMEALLAAKALSNDGSLHDAARMVDTDSIKLLLVNGHDPKYPCPRFEGRPPLFELCLQAPTYLLKTQWTAQQKEVLAKKAIDALIKGGALTKDRLPQAGNRSLLLHALDSANPHMMTKAFLECGQFKYINRDFNLFMDGEYTYSPTKYVEKGKCRGDSSQFQSLIKLLKDFKAEDRYWKINGPQPPDMVNPPEHIAYAEEERKEVERRKRAEEEEIRREIEKQQRELAAARRKLALEQEAEQAKLDREYRAFQLRQAQEAKLHAAAVAKENDRLRIQEARNSHALKQAASMSKLRNDEDEARHRRSMKLIGEKKMLAQSQEALYFAYNKGVEDAASPGGRRALGPSSLRSNLDLAGRAARLRIEGASPSRIEEVDE
ncbi:Skeletal muscle ankyrin repeat [Hyphodiscus hymeniophilus]|uniref:Skeletal muscle ankyrin repeat n=1 Tax=Hyphodiscus hymeniophilus TaxID=353542 RepID=A0A9P7AYL7_9HELO|nr:Skeletal muscle ankyrin repeat [Hyphodiscus hymeniophilus]